MKNRIFFKYFILEDDNSRVAVDWFLRNFPHTEFQGVDKVLYLYLEFCNRLGIVPSRRYLESFIKAELRGLIVKYEIIPPNAQNIFSLKDISSIEESYIILSQAFINEFDRFVEMAPIDLEMFKVEISAFISDGAKEQAINSFTKSFNMLTKHQEIDDILDTTVDRLLDLKNVYDVTKLEELDTLMGKGLNKEERARHISDTSLACINSDYGIYSKALITGAGQPGYGKTRFFLSTFIYPALINGVGCRVDSLELAKFEIVNILVSIHLSKVFKFKISDRDINRGKLTQEQDRYVSMARQDLLENPAYGKLFVFTEDLYINTLKNNMFSFFRVNPSIQVWIVDYVGLIKGNPKFKMNKAEVIDEALVVMKSIAKKKDIAAIGINQFNDEGNQAADKGVPITVGMVQGGQAVQKHSDYDIAMTATPQQNAAGMRMISTTKNRASIGFNNIPLDVDLGISRFTQREIIDRRS